MSKQSDTISQLRAEVVRMESQNSRLREVLREVLDTIDSGTLSRRLADRWDRAENLLDEIERGGR